jgi:hypothetical protein
MQTTLDCLTLESKSRLIPTDDRFLKGHSAIAFIVFLTSRADARRPDFAGEVLSFAMMDRVVYRHSRQSPELFSEKVFYGGSCSPTSGGDEKIHRTCQKKNIPFLKYH